MTCDVARELIDGVTGLGLMFGLCWVIVTYIKHGGFD